MRAKVLAILVLAVFAPGRALASDSPSIYEALAAMKTHTILHTAVKEAGEIATLKGSGQYTLFAPTDAAFKAINGNLLKKIATDKATVKALLSAHLVKGKYTTEELKKLAGKELETLLGTLLKVEELKDGFRVGGAKLVVTNVQCGNGVIHIVDVVFPVTKPAP